MSSTRSDSVLPSPVQMAPSTSQFMVAGSTMVTALFESGLTVISHLTFLPGSSRRALTTSPPVTVKAWSQRVF